MDRKVMVVDDSRLIRQEVGRTLVRGGFSVVDACDGADALRKLREQRDVLLVICDVHMPNMNGLDLLEALRSEPIAVPVVMLTTDGQHELIQRAKELGAKGWITKPFKPDLLLETARKLTGEKEPK